MKKPLKLVGKNTPEVENTARLICTWTMEMPEFGDRMMAVSVATAALIWSIGISEDEQMVRDIMAKTTEAVVAAWKAQKQYAEEQLKP